MMNPALERPFRYDLLAWFSAVHVGAAAAVYYLALVRWNTPTVVMACTLFLLCHLSITMGPHRLYAHAAYKAHPVLEMVLLVLFSGTIQSSALWWSAYHIRHHLFSDTEQDPYTVKHGLLWAHCLWLLYSTDEVPPQGRRLMRNPLLVWQHKQHVRLGLLIGLLLPTALGALWGDWLGGLLVGGFLRLCAQYHATWCINSVSHSFGHRRYGGTATTNPLLGIPTVGEGSAHDRHHCAPGDYRIDPRWWAPDIGKWVIWLCSCIGLASDLRRTPEDTVLAVAFQKERRPEASL